MKFFHLKKGLLALVALVMLTRCTNEDLSPIPTPETGVHGYAKYTQGSAQDFIYTGNNGLSFDFQWISLDKLNTVTKIEFFVTFNDRFLSTDDGTYRTARIGGTLGRKFKTIDGGSVPANRTNINVTLTQEELYQLYADATYAYDSTGVQSPVFNDDTDNNALRIDGARFVPGDNFKIRWELTTADGRLFKQWSDGICAEYETYHDPAGVNPNNGGFNCTIDFAVKCESNIGGVLDYVQTNMIQGGGGPVPGTISGQVTWTQNLDANGDPLPGSYSTTDGSFGHFPEVWSDDPVTGVTIVDACNNLSLGGTDQYGDTYTYQIQSIAGPVMTIHWLNTYGDEGDVILTRADGANWPPLTGG
jgi:hypothetical protein